MSPSAINAMPMAVRASEQLVSSAVAPLTTTIPPSAPPSKRQRSARSVPASPTLMLADTVGKAPTAERPTTGFVDVTIWRGRAGWACRVGGSRVSGPC